MAEHRHFSAQYQELENGIIEITFSGDLGCDQCAVEFDKFSVGADRSIIKKAKEDLQKVNLLINANGLGNLKDVVVSPLMQSVDRTKAYENRTAVYGAPPLIKTLVDTIVALTRHDEVRFFSTREEALVWLNAEPRASL